MSKTVELQIEKSRNLVQGLRKYILEGGRDLSEPEVNDMELELGALAEACEECERLRAELAPKVRQMNKILADVKNRYIARKMIIKSHFPQERWADYGLPDKR